MRNNFGKNRQIVICWIKIAREYTIIVFDEIFIMR